MSSRITQRNGLFGVLVLIFPRSKEGGRKLSHSNADHIRWILKEKILSSFKNFKLSEITPAHIENWMFKLQKKNLAGRSINIYYNTLQIIMGEATWIGDLTINPCLNIKRMAEKKKK